MMQIDLSQRALRPIDSRLVKMALLQNAHLGVLKLGYNNLGDEGTCILAEGIAKHQALQSIDLGFNNIGDVGCQALATAIASARSGTLHTLYLAGNLIGPDGAFAIADLLRRGSSLRRLYLTGNKIRAEGVGAITGAIIEAELRNDGGDQSSDADDSSTTKQTAANYSATAARTTTRSCEGMKELFLGGTDMGSDGCRSVGQLLARTTSLKVLSLTNCEFGDDCIAQLAASIKANRDNLPLESLQLSFNRIGCRGIEHLFNAIWGSQILKELRLDNNKIGDLGAQHVAGVLPTLRTLETLDIGFNTIKTRGIMFLSKAIADSSKLKFLSVCGNKLDTNAAKALTYALAYSQSLTTLELVGCGIGEEGQRQIVAGIVSNKHTTIREFSGFEVGPIIVTLGFPAALEHWSNEQVFNFVHLMWTNIDSDLLASEEEERMTDPLSFLDGDETSSKPAPLEAGVVVKIAKETFESLVEQGIDVFSKASTREDGYACASSPIADDGIVFEDLHERSKRTCSRSGSSVSPSKTDSFVTPPEEPKSSAPDPARKKRIVEWLCANIQHLNKLAQLPFSSSELGRLHQRYFTPVVNESGGSVAPSQTPSAELLGMSASSVPMVSLTSSSGNPADVMSDGTSEAYLLPSGDSSAITSLPIMKRKVSYRCLGDAALASAPRLESGFHNQQWHPGSVSMLIEGGPGCSSLPRKSKRARRNRSRISFLPRIKAKLDSYLDVCHEKALITMRQLYYVERAILSGQVNPIDPSKTVRTHLCGEFASDAETIICDMI